MKQISLNDCIPCVGSPHGDGYYTIRRDGKNRLEHRQAYADHIGVAYDELTVPHVRHLCHNRGCRNVEHLAAGTAMSNRDDSVAVGKHKWPVLRGDANPAAIITAGIAAAIRAHCSDGRRGCQAEMARKYGLSRQHVSDIIRNKIWRE